MGLWLVGFEGFGLGCLFFSLGLCECKQCLVLGEIDMYGYG